MDYSNPFNRSTGVQTQSPRRSFAVTHRIIYICGDLTLDFVSQLFRVGLQFQIFKETDKGKLVEYPLCLLKVILRQVWFGT